MPWRQSVEKTTADELRRRNPGAKCCNCGAAADKAPQDEVWIIWNGTRVFCPQCADELGISE
jgi:hypothetical protein